MRSAITTLSILLLASGAFADDDSCRARLTGRWQQVDGQEDALSNWTLTQGPNDSIHVANSIGTQAISEFECNTMGKDCELKAAGRKSKVSMWFNGPKLVEMETTGAQVVKRRFAITGEGDTMDVETIPIAPPGKVEISHFKRIPPVVAKE